ncbi:MAG TPA: DUF418 domain-containing protein [Sediminibacterium sp.]|nr:DUF418 domain-containing protein [Sediminibacterium sp.]
MENVFKKDRILTVDALRGIALLGILLAHMCFWYNGGPLPEEIFKRYSDPGSTVVSILNEVLISGKFFAFFSFLFGLSFYLQMSRKAQQDNFVLRYGWRIALMGIIGLIHHAFWRGDILSIYAPLGFILLLARKWNNRWILFTGIFFAANIPLVLIETVRLLTPGTTGMPGQGVPANYEAESRAFYAIYTGNSWISLWKDNLRNLSDKFNFQFNSGRIYITFGFFLLGMYFGRQNWFNRMAIAAPVFRKIKKNLFWLALVCLLLALGMFAANELFKLNWQQNRTVGLFFGILYNLFNGALVMIYITGFSLLLQKNSWQTFGSWFASIGKMALTCYLSQTLLGLLLFYGVGLGLVGKTHPALNWLMGILFFVVQVVFCRWWLKKYQYGPVEWIWRSATYFRFYPIRVRTAAPLSENQSKTA